MIGEIIILFLTFFLFYKTKTLYLSEKHSQQKISVIIPARNEGNNLPALLESLKKQDIQPFEIIVVDDNSSDKTFDIAKSFGVNVISIKNRPEGWLGKNYACYTGAKIATGEILLFLDADLILKPTAIRKLTCTYKNNTVLSVQPYHFMERTYEQMSMFFNAIAVAAVGVCYPGKDKSIGLFGPVIMIDRNQYFDFGGHEIVKNEVIEDYMLGEKLRKLGIECNLYLGYDSISYRMYNGGFKQLIWGWSKNFSSGALNTPLLYFLMTFAWVAAYYSISISFFSKLVTIISSGIPDIISIGYILLYFVYGIILFIKLRKIGNFNLVFCVLFFIPLLVFSFVFLFSMILKFVIRKVKWKDRWISLTKINKGEDIKSR